MRKWSRHRKTTELGTCDLNWNTLKILQKQLNFYCLYILHEEIIFFPYRKIQNYQILAILLIFWGSYNMGSMFYGVSYTQKTWLSSAIKEPKPVF